MSRIPLHDLARITDPRWIEQRTAEWYDRTQPDRTTDRPHARSTTAEEYEAEIAMLRAELAQARLRIKRLEAEARNGE